MLTLTNLCRILHIDRQIELREYKVHESRVEGICSMLFGCSLKTRGSAFVRIVAAVAVAGVTLVPMPVPAGIERGRDRDCSR